MGGAPFGGPPFGTPLPEFPLLGGGSVPFEDDDEPFVNVMVPLVDSITPKLIGGMGGVELGAGPKVKMFFRGPNPSVMGEE